MSKATGLASLLMISTALIAPAVARAQGAPNAPADAASGLPSPPAAQPAEADAGLAPADETPDISIPGASGAGGDIVVTGRRNTNIARALPQVVSVLSNADIARTGEGNIAGALGRVTGLSVVGNGFVYVRGLGDRYSLALLNGSPLPSPEPLRRTVPLDLFPTGVISSSLVQKTYSANFPGEFGGGVINLTTKAVPAEPFLTIGAGIGVDSETTGRLGYTYYGSKTDWTGFDNGERDLPPALRSFLSSGKLLSEVDTRPIAAQLVTGRNSIVQRNRDIPVNWSASLSGGTSFDLGGVTLGVIASAGYSNRWRTRDTLQQTASSADLSQADSNFQRVITDDRVVVNGLLGFGLEFGGNKVRWTNLYIRDTLKQARLGVGSRNATAPDATFLQQDTAWYERQLIDTQIVGEFKPLSGLSVDVRGGYANSQREAPDEFSYEYYRSNNPNDPYGAFFINLLNGNRGEARVRYSDLNENLWSGGVDVTYEFTPDVSAMIGYAYSDTNRRSERRDFLFRSVDLQQPGNEPIGLFRPDLLLQPSVVNFYNIQLLDSDPGNPVFRAKLRNHAGYGQLQVDFTDSLSLNAGVRYEQARQTVAPIQVFTTPVISGATTNLDRDYWLPAATLTWKLPDDMQVRLSASKTIARPQFRELIYQLFFDPDNNRQFRGNPLLTDSQLYNAEARYEWYFARDQRISVAGFYKRIKNPIEAFSSIANDNTVITSFANAPEATLYGAEIETQKYFDLNGFSDAPFFATRRVAVIANYTYTKSKLKVSANDTVAVFANSSTSATDFFQDGAPLTGQSDHLVNFQIGLEDTDHLSQQTLLFTYASPRVTSRGASLQPDIIEKPGIRIDFVARQGIQVLNHSIELKLEVRNITGTRYQELQQSGSNKIFYNRYDVGTSATFGASINF